jgi:hypothetical protein
MTPSGFGLRQPCRVEYGSAMLLRRGYKGHVCSVLRLDRSHMAMTRESYLVYCGMAVMRLKFGTVREYLLRRADLSEVHSDDEVIGTVIGAGSRD